MWVGRGGGVRVGVGSGPSGGAAVGRGRGVGIRGRSKMNSCRVFDDIVVLDDKLCRYGSGRYGVRG